MCMERGKHTHTGLLGERYIFAFCITAAAFKECFFSMITLIYYVGWESRFYYNKTRTVSSYSLLVNVNQIVLSLLLNYVFLVSKNIIYFTLFV